MIWYSKINISDSEIKDDVLINGVDTFAEYHTISLSEGSFSEDLIACIHLTSMSFVYINGETAKKTGKTVINSVSDFQFFKLNDRKYLIIANSIWTENRDINTGNYLIVELDKKGNAVIYNSFQDLCCKPRKKRDLDNVIPKHSCNYFHNTWRSGYFLT